MGEQLNLTEATWTGEALESLVRQGLSYTDAITKGICNINFLKNKGILAIPRIEISEKTEEKATESKGSITIESRILSPKQIELYSEFNPTDFEAHFTESSKDEFGELEATVENYLALAFMKRFAGYLDSMLFNSRLMFKNDCNPEDKGYSDNSVKQNGGYYFDGFVYKALTDPYTHKILRREPYDRSLKKNLLEDMLKILLNNPNTKEFCNKYGPFGLRYFMNWNDFGSCTTFGKYKEYNIVPLIGLEPGTIFLTVGRPDMFSNFHIGVDVTNGGAELKKKDDALWSIKVVFSMDVNHSFGDQMVLFTNIKK